MTERVIIRPRDRDLTRIETLCCDAAGQCVLSSHHTIEELADDLSANSEVWFLAPTQCVRLTEVATVGQSRARLQQAVPFMLEDTLACDVEAVHTVLTASDKVNTSVAVVAHAHMAQWLAHLALVRHRLRAIVPDVFMLPYVVDAWTIVVADDVVWVRTGVWQGFSIERDNSALWLQLHYQGLADDERPVRAVLIPTTTVAEQQYTDLVPAGLSFDVEEVVASPLALWQPENSARQSQAANLLQGSYRVGIRVPEVAGCWRWAKRLAVLWCALLLATRGIDYAYWHAQAEHYEQASLQILHRVLPTVRDTANAKALVTRFLRQRNAHTMPGGFIAILADLSGVIEPQQAKAQLKRVHYAKKIMQVQLSVTDFDTLAEVERQLRAARLQVTRGDARSVGQRVQARLILKK